MQKFEIMKKEFQIAFLSNLAICFKKKSDFQKAIRFHNMVFKYFLVKIIKNVSNKIQKALEIEPKNITQILKRGFTYIDAGNIKDAKFIKKI